MIECEDLTDMNGSFDFENLNYNRRIRRKSCICSFCSGAKLVHRKGINLVLESDFPYCNDYKFRKFSPNKGSETPITTNL